MKKSPLFCTFSKQRTHTKSLYSNS